MNPPGLINTQQPLNRAHPLARGLQAWWLTIPQWYGGNKWYDLCGLNPGTLTNMTAGFGWQPSTRPGGMGHVAFDGTNDYVDAGNSAALNFTTAFTMAGWVRMRTLSNAFNQVFMRNNANTQFYGLLVRSTGIITRQISLNGGTNSSIDSTAALSAGVWYHLAFTYDSSLGSLNGKLYINGVLDTSTQTYTSGCGTNTAVLSLGRDAVNGRYLDGAEDGWHAYSRALSAAEVQALYNESRLGYPGLLRRLTGPLAGDADVAVDPLAWMFHDTMRKDPVRIVRY